MSTFDLFLENDTKHSAIFLSALYIQKSSFINGYERR
jgi:hypothetical protein